MAALPELPLGVWDTTRSESALHSLIEGWWSEHCLHKKLGDLAKEVCQTLMGLIVLSRKRAIPAAYFAAACQQPRSYLRRAGQEWFAAIQKSRSHTR